MTTLDPIFPLPAGTGLPKVRQGEGKSIFQNDGTSGSGMTNRAFHVVWEQVELRAAQNYPKYVGGGMDHVAQAWLEAVVWFRRIAYPGMDIDPISETKAQKVRAKEAAEAKKKPVKKGASPEQAKTEMKKSTSTSPQACPQCGETELIATEKKGKPIWKCFECEHKWPREPREAPKSPSKAPNKAGGSQAPGKQEKKPKKSKNKGKKGKKKTRT